MNQTQNLNELRSQLNFCIPDELQNLTIQDLSEFTWKTQKLVFSALINATKSLQPFADTLSDLNQKVNRNFNQLRAQKQLRENRKALEEEYRHQFFEIILQVCYEVQYPPALVPFSNPLQSLLEDSEFKIQLVSYILSLSLNHISARSPKDSNPRANLPVSKPLSSRSSSKSETPRASDASLCSVTNDTLNQFAEKSPRNICQETDAVSSPCLPDQSQSSIHHSAGDYEILYLSFQVAICHQ
jgi:hypothetical protein